MPFMPPTQLARAIAGMTLDERREFIDAMLAEEQESEQNVTSKTQPKPMKWFKKTLPVSKLLRSHEHEAQLKEYLISEIPAQAQSPKIKRGSFFSAVQAKRNACKQGLLNISSHPRSPKSPSPPKNKLRKSLHPSSASATTSLEKAAYKKYSTFEKAVWKEMSLMLGGKKARMWEWMYTDENLFVNYEKHLDAVEALGRGDLVCGVHGKEGRGTGEEEMNREGEEGERRDGEEKRCFCVVFEFVKGKGKQRRFERRVLDYCS